MGQDDKYAHKNNDPNGEDEEDNEEDNCDIWHLPSDSSIAGTSSGTSSNSAAC